jgi:predicted glycosyltransferase
LHPATFSPDHRIVQKYFSKEQKYFLIRLVSFTAGHDIEMAHGGLRINELHKLIGILEKHGRVFITSESKIPAEFEKYKLIIDVKDIHHILAFAYLFIADSQSMIMEAAMLGTPSIRYNSFVGKISVLEELENEYGLTTGIHNSKPDLLIKKVEELLKIQDLRKEFITRKLKMLSDKIDVNRFMTWFIENYPESEKIMRENPDYQKKFK